MAFLESLERVDSKNILVIGDILLDKYNWGEVRKLNPDKKTVPLITMNSRENYVLGGAANVAHNIVSLGGKCQLFGFLGNDGFAKVIEDLCLKKNIQLFYTHSDKCTLVKQRIMTGEGQSIRLDWGEDVLEKVRGTSKEKLLEQIKSQLPFADFVILSDYDKNVFSPELTKEVIKLCREFKKPIMADPKPQNIELFVGCNLVSPNKEEASKISGIDYKANEEVLKKIAKGVMDKVCSDYVIITCGRDGVFVYADGFGKLISTKAKEVIDRSGAGDTFAAACVLGLASGLNISDSVIFGNYAAGVVVEKMGTATATMEEVLKRIEEDTINSKS